VSKNHQFIFRAASCLESVFFRAGQPLVVWCKNAFSLGKIQTTQIMNSTIKPWIVVVAIFAAPVLELHATPITFDLRDATTATITDEIESGTLTRGGITATLTPFVDGSSGVLNQTGSGFGINASGSDASDQLDGDEGIESIFISFNADVSFTSLKLSQFGSSDSALLTIAGFTELSIGSSSQSFLTDNFVPTGETVRLKYGTGNGFSFDSFTIDAATQPTVPDSLPFGFTAAVLIGVTLLARRFKYSSHSIG
jgi:hypothetical protein